MRSIWNMITRNNPSPPARVAEMPDSAPKPGDAIAQRTVCEWNPHLCGISDIGRSRDCNEDAFRLSPSGDWFVVADGMGGHEAGEVAAALAIKAIGEHLTEERLAAAREAGDASDLLRAAVIAADECVYQANKARQGGDMGCTIAVAAFVNGLVTCHVGDVRAYLQRGETLYQVTRDHSTVSALVEAGQLTPEEARTHANRSEVLQAIGMPPGVRPDVNRVDLLPGDRVLLCSDGLWESFPSTEIEAILASDGTMRQLATQLVDRANSGSAPDNITAVLFEVT